MCTDGGSAGIGISMGVGATLNNIGMSSVGSIGTVGSISNNGNNGSSSNNITTNITSTSSCEASQQNPANRPGHELCFAMAEGQVKSMASPQLASSFVACSSLRFGPGCP